MKKIFKFNMVLIGLTAFCSSYSCVKGDDFKIPEANCSENVVANKTVTDIFGVATSTATRYSADDIIEGYVCSSDQGGNFFKSISIQTMDGSLGFSVPIDQTDLYTIYNPGRKVYIKLLGSYTEIDNDALEIGDLFIDNFQNETVGRIAYPAYENIVLKSCEVVDEDLLVKRIAINNISDVYINTLVEFSGVQFVEEALGNTLYDSDNDLGGSATNHLIQDDSGATLIFRTSAFADFAPFSVPEGNGTIRGVITKFDGKYQLFPRTFFDVNLDNERVDFQSSIKNNLFFTEIADPNNNADARFLEIYNGEDVAINLNGWTVRRYTNDNSSVSSSINLAGSTINAGQAFVIAVNGAEFETVFGFVPDLVGATNGPADSNGDDNLELVDPFGNVVDIFGVIGEDGSGTNHEFEDGRALRNFSISKGNPIYTFSEWQIWNDTGDAGTINEPQDAPGNFTPGVR